MALEKEVAVIHPEGEPELAVLGGPSAGSTVDTFGGTIHVRRDETAAVTPFGQSAFFVEFLKTAGLWEARVKDCPVTYQSPNAPRKAEVLGSILLSVPAGHRRYAHITALRFHGVNPQLLGMTKSVARIRCGARFRRWRRRNAPPGRHSICESGLSAGTDAAARLRK
jgi:hypothetical protein